MIHLFFAQNYTKYFPKIKDNLDQPADREFEHPIDKMVEL
jgi:hypothetical protein